MASTKSTKKSKAKPSKKEKTAPENSGTDLLALDASYEAPIDLPVAVILQDAKEIQGLLKKLGKRLLERSRLDEALLADLPERAARLNAAELRWTSVRKLQLPTQRKKLRQQAEELRSDTIAALRHFTAEDATTQARLNRIVEGSGLADLIDDLKKLAPLVDKHQAQLRRATLPENTSGRLASLASALEEATEDESAERIGTDEARQALALRNRAYWHLRGATDEIRECARYAFRNEPELSKLFRSLSTVRRGKISGQKPAPTA